MTKHISSLLIGLVVSVVLFVGMASAQNIRVVATCGNQTLAPGVKFLGYFTVDPTGTLCTAASVSASITGFPTVQSTGTPISVTTGGVTGTLPAGAVVVASNVGATNGAYCKLGASATTSDQLIPPNSWFSFTVGANTQLTCITSTSTTTVNMVGGSGLPTGSGGGGGGGSGGAVTNAGTFAVQVTADSTAAALLSAVQAAVPVGTNTIGSVGFDPSLKSPLSAPINVSTATTTQLVALSGATLIYVTSFDVIAGGTGNITFVYGTGSSCGTGTTSLTGAYPLVAQAGISKGSGVATVLKVPSGNALCVTTSAAVQMSGSVSYMQF